MQFYWNNRVNRKKKAKEVKWSTFVVPRKNSFSRLSQERQESHINLREKSTVHRYFMEAFLGCDSGSRCCRYLSGGPMGYFSSLEDFFLTFSDSKSEVDLANHH